MQADELRDKLGHLHACRDRFLCSGSFAEYQERVHALSQTLKAYIHTRLVELETADHYQQQDSMDQREAELDMLQLLIDEGRKLVYSAIVGDEDLELRMLLLAQS